MYDLLLKSESPRFYWPFQPLSQNGDGKIRLHGRVTGFRYISPVEGEIDLLTRDGFNATAIINPEVTTTQIYMDQFGEDWYLPKVDGSEQIHEFDWSSESNGGTSELLWQHNDKTIDVDSFTGAAIWPRAMPLGKDELSKDIPEKQSIRITWAFHATGPVQVQTKQNGEWRIFNPSGEYSLQTFSESGANSISIFGPRFKLIKENQNPVTVTKRFVRVEVLVTMENLFEKLVPGQKDYIVFEGSQIDEGLGNKYLANTLHVAHINYGNYFTDKSMLPTVAGKGTRVNLVIDAGINDKTQPLTYETKYRNRDVYVKPNPDTFMHPLWPPTEEVARDLGFYDRCSIFEVRPDRTCVLFKSKNLNIQTNEHVTASVRITNGHNVPKVSNDPDDDKNNYPKGARDSSNFIHKYQLGVRWFSDDMKHCIDEWNTESDFSSGNRQYFTTRPPSSRLSHPRMIVRAIGDKVEKENEEVHLVDPILEQTPHEMSYFSGLSRRATVNRHKSWESFNNKWEDHDEEWEKNAEFGTHIQESDSDVRLTAEGNSVFGVHRKNLLGSSGFSGVHEPWHKLKDAFGRPISNPSIPTQKISVNGRREYTFSFDINCAVEPDRLVYRKVETTWLVTYYTNFVESKPERMFSEVFVTKAAAGPDVRAAFTFETPEWCSCIDIVRYDKAIYLGRHPFNEDFGGPSADYIDALQNLGFNENWGSLPPEYVDDFKSTGRYEIGGIEEFKKEFEFLFQKLNSTDDHLPGTSISPDQPDADALPPEGPYWWGDKIDDEDGTIYQSGVQWPPASWKAGVPGSEIGEINAPAPRPWDFGTNTLGFAEMSDFMLEHHDRGLSHVLSEEDYSIGRNWSFSERMPSSDPIGPEGQSIYLSDIDVYAGWGRFQQGAYSDSALHLIPGAYIEKRFDGASGNKRNSLRFADYNNALRPFYIECFFAVNEYKTVYDIWRFRDTRGRSTASLVYGDGTLRFAIGQGRGEITNEFVLPEEKSYLVGAAFDGQSIKLYVNGTMVSSTSTYKILSFEPDSVVETLRSEVYIGKAWLSHLSVFDGTLPASEYRMSQRLDSTNINEITEQYNGDLDTTVYDMDNYDPTIMDHFITYYPDAWKNALNRFHFRNIELGENNLPTLRKIPEMLVYSAATKEESDFSWVYPVAANSDEAPRFPLTSHFLRYENNLASVDTKNIAVHATFTFKYDPNNLWNCDNAWVISDTDPGEGDFVQKPDEQHRPAIYLRDSKYGDAFVVFTYVKEEEYKGKTERFLYVGLEYRDYNIDSIFPFRFKRSMKETRYLLRVVGEELASDPQNIVFVQRDTTFGNQYEYKLTLGIVNVGLEWVAVVARADGRVVDGSAFPKILPSSQPVIEKDSVVLIGEDELGEAYFGSFFKNKLQAQDVRQIAFGHTKTNSLKRVGTAFDLEYLMDVSTFVYPMGGTLAAAQRGRIIGALSPRIAAQEGIVPDEVSVSWEPQMSNIAVFSGQRQLNNYDDIAVEGSVRSDGLYPFEVVLSTYDSWNDVPVLYNFYIAAAQNAAIESDNSEGIVTVREPFSVAIKNSLIFDNSRRQGVFFNENDGYLEYAPPYTEYNLIRNDDFDSSTSGWYAYFMNGGEDEYTFGVSPEKALYGSNSAKINVSKNITPIEASKHSDIEVWSDYIPVIDGAMYSLSTAFKTSHDCNFRYGVSFYDEDGKNIHVDGFDDYIKDKMKEVSLPTQPLSDGEHDLFTGDIPFIRGSFYQLNLIYTVECDYKLTIQLGENVVNGETVYDLNETYYLTPSNSKGGAALNVVFQHQVLAKEYKSKIILENLGEDNRGNKSNDGFKNLRHECVKKLCFYW